MTVELGAGFKGRPPVAESVFGDLANIVSTLDSRLAEMDKRITAVTARSNNVQVQASPVPVQVNPTPVQVHPPQVTVNVPDMEMPEMGEISIPGMEVLPEVRDLLKQLVDIFSKPVERKIERGVGGLITSVRETRG